MKSWKRIILVCFLSLLFILTNFNSSYAQTAESLIYPVPPQLQNSYFGQDHSYSVNFRGNGEAVVTIRAVLSNNSEAPLSKVDIRVPKVDPKDVLVFQVLREPICTTFEPMTSNCIRYQEPNYFEYYGYGAEYRKANVEYVGDTLKIALPKDIKAGSSGSYLLYYRALGYAKKNFFNGYNFSFETLKTNDKIQNLQVGVNTDSDIFLKGASSKVNYRYDESFAALKAMPSTDGIRNSQIDNLYSQIGQGEIYKNASNLAALESYTVKGSFADSRVKLFGKEILIGALVVLGFVLLVFVSLKLILSRVKRETKSPNSANALIVFGTSFASSLFVFGYTILIHFFGKNLNDIIVPVNYEFQTILFLLLIVVSIAVYVLLGVVPSMVVGIKKGSGWGVASFVATIVWLGVYLIGFLVVVMIFGSPQPNYPIPLTKYDSVEPNQAQTGPTPTPK